MFYVLLHICVCVCIDMERERERERERDWRCGSETKRQKDILNSETDAGKITEVLYSGECFNNKQNECLVWSLAYKALRL